MVRVYERPWGMMTVIPEKLVEGIYAHRVCASDIVSNAYSFHYVEPEDLQSFEGVAPGALSLPPVLLMSYDVLGYDRKILTVEEAYIQTTPEYVLALLRSANYAGEIPPCVAGKSENPVELLGVLGMVVAHQRRKSYISFHHKWEEKILNRAKLGLQIVGLILDMKTSLEDHPIVTKLTQRGSRIGAWLSANDTTVDLLGYGEYVGSEVPPEDIIGPFGPASLFGRENPKLKLDDGTVVWGCECWWGPEDAMKEKIQGREVLQADIAEYRRVAREVWAPHIEAVKKEMREADHDRGQEE